MSYYNIDVYHRSVTTQAPEAQLWFNRGLIWTYAFFHEEALACFGKAIAADPDCAMAHWGRAYAIGPNYNMPWELHDTAMLNTALATAYDATQAALTLVDATTPVEKALIQALQKRYPQRDPADIDRMESWNRDFADTMADIQSTYPSDLDVRTIRIESLMNLTPWKMWDETTGAPTTEGTTEARALAEDAFQNQPDAMKHPGLLHLYVHLMEMSATPEVALNAGDALRDLVPDAGHLIHMPTHIDIQCGDYQSVYYWNRKAVEADKLARDRMGIFNIYTGYRIHNSHFAAYGAMFLGQFEAAYASAREMVDDLPEEFLRVTSPPFADYYESYLAPWVHVLIRFGRWQQIIDEPLPDDPVLFANQTATLHYAKGVAHAALGNIERAEAARTDFHAARDAVPATRSNHNVMCSEQLAVATAMLDGEIEYRKGNYDVAFQSLRDAIALEDALPYDEPWGWMQPVRHALGALLLEQGHVVEAETVYREDLGLGGDLPRAQIHPDNVWSLRGLNACLAAQGTSDTPEGRHISQRLALAEARADPSTGVSCFCAETNA